MTTLRRRALLVLLAAAPLLATAQPGPTLVHTPDPAEAFATLEQFFLDAEHVAADQITVRADSALTVDLRGYVWLGPEGRARIRTRGVFLDFGMDTTPSLVSDGVRMVGGRSAEVGFDTTAAPALREALALGFTRMGLLPILISLHTGSPPSHADGGMADWVTVHDFAWLPEVRHRGRAVRPLAFTIRVAGEDTGEAVLYLDGETGLPLHRTQTTTFATSRVYIDEEYAGWMIIHPPEGTFSVDPGPFE